MQDSNRSIIDLDIDATQETGETDALEPRTRHIETLKLPPFWNSRPDLWFIQVESQFRIRGITTNATKYDHLVSCLPTDIIELVSDFISNAPRGESYERLKKLILSRSADSEQRRLDNLLNQIDIGDQKPSELYRHMESLASDNSLVNKNLLWELWVQKLPPSLRPCVIAMKDSQSLEQTFTMIDRIHDSTRTAPKVSSVGFEKGNCSADESLINAINKLSGRIEKLETRFSRSRSRFNGPSRRGYSNSRSRNRSVSRSNVPQRHDRFCYYHTRFGVKAKKCIAPCEFKARGEISDDHPKN